MADPFSANRQTQIGVESVLGTAVAANKLLPSLALTLDPAFNVNKYKARGRRFTGLVVPTGDESTGGKLSGGLTFTEFVYAASMIWGAAQVTTPANAVNARQWKWNVPLSGRVNPKSMTIEQGDTDDAERVSAGVLLDIGFELSKTASNLTGTLLARAIEKAGAGAWSGMTSNPTSLGLVPVLPTKWDAFMDDAPQSGAGASGTKLLRCFKSVVDYGGAYTPYYTMDSSLSSYAGLADSDDVKATFGLTLIKDSVGEALWTKARAGQRKFVRLFALGDSAENFVTISITGSPASGNFCLVYGGVTSQTIPYNATPSQVQNALDGMSSLGPGNTAVSLVSGSQFPTAVMRVEFKGSHVNDAASQVFTVANNQLSPSGTASFGAHTVIPSSMQVDLAGNVSKPGGDQDLQATRVRDWDFEIVEDSTLGGALIVTVINGVTALT